MDEIDLEYEDLQLRKNKPEGKISPKVKTRKEFPEKLIAEVIKLNSLSMNYNFEERSGRIGIHFKSNTNISQNTFDEKIVDNIILDGIKSLIQLFTGVQSNQISIGKMSYSCNGEDRLYHINLWRNFILNKANKKLDWIDLILSIGIRNITGIEGDIESGIFQIELALSKELDDFGHWKLDESKSTIKFLEENYSTLGNIFKRIFDFEKIDKETYDINFTEPSFEDISFPLYLINGLITPKE